MLSGVGAIRNADLGASALTDVRLDDHAREYIDAKGCAVVAGLTDHHLHLHAMAAAAASVSCGPPTVKSRPELVNALGTAPPDPGGWIRGVGYVESVAGVLDRDSLDVMSSVRPVRIQHRSGAMWMLNSAAADAVGLDGAPHPGIERDPRGRATGRVWRGDDWLRSRVPSPGPPDLTAVGNQLKRLGIVEITDATPDLDETSIRSLVASIDSGAIPQRLHLLGVPLSESLDHPRITVGPHKIVIADSQPPDLDDLVVQMTTAHNHGRGVAVHCVSAVAFALLLAAWSAAGVHRDDRIEHAGVVPLDACRTLRDLGVTVVTQPGFIAARGDDFLRDSDPQDHDDLYRCGTLLDAGVDVVLSSDAPYGPLSPWQNMRAAVNRRTEQGRRIGSPDELLSASTALNLYQRCAATPAGPARSLANDDISDILVLDRSLRDVLREPGDVAVTHTLIAGHVV